MPSSSAVTNPAQALAVQLRDGALAGHRPGTETVSNDLKCPHCGYEWTYGGTLLKATCPSCKGTVQVDEHAVEAEESDA